jgi:hypothetical protein
MADINVQMPSENEDFDATADNAQPVTETPDFSKPEETTPEVVEPSAPAAAPAPEVSAPEAEAPAPEVVAPVIPQTPKAKMKLPMWPIVTGLLALAVVGLGFYSFSLMSAKKDVETKLAAANANPQLLVQKQTDALIANVAKLMTLPAGETPTVANVSDATKAKAQSAFFANAQNGDRVLMYAKAGEAILYRPSTNKVILVAPLTFNNTAATTTKK